MGAGNFNFPLNFEKWGIFSSKFCIFDEQFSDKKKFSYRLKFWVAGSWFPASFPLPWRHWV